MMTLLVIATVLMLNVSVLLEDNLNYLTVCSFLFYTQFYVFHSDIFHHYCSVVTIFFVCFFCCKTCFLVTIMLL